MAKCRYSPICAVWDAIFLSGSPPVIRELRWVKNKLIKGEKKGCFQPDQLPALAHQAAPPTGVLTGRRDVEGTNVERDEGVGMLGKPDGSRERGHMGLGE